MIEIQLAGAGAGKTYGMAEKILQQFDPKSHKLIFAITYTNKATENIAEAIIDQLGYLPETIKVCTVHTFLLNEVIYPYSPVMLDQVYTTSSRCSLTFVSRDGETKTRTQLQRERGSIIARLKAKQVVHVEEVYAVARKILDPNHSTNRPRAKKAKVAYIHDILKSSINKIFLDEAQDLDKTAIQALDAVGKNVVDIYMVGDPKQAIKFPDAFREYVAVNENEDHVNVLPNNNESRRVPQRILNVSNLFCPAGQEQTSLSDVEGELHYVLSTDQGYDEFLNSHINSDSLVSIYRKEGNYSTKDSESLPYLQPDINELLIQHNPKIDEDLVLGAAIHWLDENIGTNTDNQVSSDFLTKFKIPYSGKSYAQLRSSINDYKSANANSAQYHISSIDRTKGLEAESCVIILNKAIYKFLVRDRLRAADRHNTTWNKVYVALTRSLSNVILVVDEQVCNDRPLDEITSKLEDLGFSRLNLNNGQELQELEEA
ncbi:UvrD-helicase domain-containing protein [Agaribacterium haliotis]|uniref:UvrD-helicase domain-containing protein n=1 Tax=Agaribacterium haliotis TaxID=2013869 RepID=UPI000BB5372A|nr:UvrD-helicase domain-containing protein [Agaribacterium haliotis]